MRLLCPVFMRMSLSSCVNNDQALRRITGPTRAKEAFPAPGLFSASRCGLALGAAVPIACHCGMAKYGQALADHAKNRRQRAEL